MVVVVAAACCCRVEAYIGVCGSFWGRWGGGGRLVNGRQGDGGDTYRGEGVGDEGGGYGGDDVQWGVCESCLQLS